MGKRSQPAADSDNARAVKRTKSNARGHAVKEKEMRADIAQFLDIEATEGTLHTDSEEDNEENIADNDKGESVEDVEGEPMPANDVAGVIADSEESDTSGHSAHSLAGRKVKDSSPHPTAGVETNAITEETTSGEPESPSLVGSVTQAAGSATTHSSKGKGTLVQAKLAKPDGSKGIDWGYSDSVNGRINVARAMASAKTDTYAFAKAPADLTWTKVLEDDKDPYYALAVAGTQKAIKLWGVGNVTRTYFFTASGDPPFSVSANIRLIHENDNVVANTVLAHHAAPRLSRPLPYTDVRFGKWMAVRHAGDTMMTNDTFVDVYDARQGIKLPKSKMNQYPPQNLKKGDLVLVESTVQRYHPKVNGRSDPKKWNPTYSIEFIALLANTPPPTTLAAKICDDELVIDF